MRIFWHIFYCPSFLFLSIPYSPKTITFYCFEINRSHIIHCNWINSQINIYIYTKTSTYNPRISWLYLNKSYAVYTRNQFSFNKFTAYTLLFDCFHRDTSPNVFSSSSLKRLVINWRRTVRHPSGNWRRNTLRNCILLSQFTQQRQQQKS